MAIAVLINDNGCERSYRTNDRRIITLKFEDESQITFWEDDKQLGHNDDFFFLEDDFLPKRYLLARMYVPIPQMGLGRAAVQFFIEMTGATVYTRPHGGIVRDDGSHLTEDAPGFVAKMIKEGLIEDNQERPYEGWFE